MGFRFDVLQERLEKLDERLDATHDEVEDLNDRIDDIEANRLPPSRIRATPAQSDAAVNMP